MWRHQRDGGRGTGFRRAFKAIVLGDLWASSSKGLLLIKLDFSTKIVSDCALLNFKAQTQMASVEEHVRDINETTMCSFRRVWTLASLGDIYFLSPSQPLFHYKGVSPW